MVLRHKDRSTSGSRTKDNGDLWVECAKRDLLKRLDILTALEQLSINPGDDHCRELILAEIRKIDVRRIVQPDGLHESNPDVPNIVDGPIRLGTIEHSGLPWGITPEILKRCMLLLGQTGSGKSTALVTVIRGLHSLCGNKLIWIIFDRKNEFAALAESLEIPYLLSKDYPDHHFTPPDSSIDDLYFNVVSEITARNIGLHALGQSIIHRELSDLSRRRKQGGQSYPSTRDLARHMLERANSAKGTTREALLRVGMHLHSFADYSGFFTSNDAALDWATIARVGCVVNLAGLPVNLQFDTIALTFAKQVLHSVVNNLRSDKLRVIFPLDECQPIFGAGQSRTLATFMDFFMQARAFGIGVIGCSQTTNLCHEFLANTATKVAFSLGHGQDYARFANAVGLDSAVQQRMHRFIRPGQAIVKDPRWPVPFSVQVLKGEDYLGSLTGEQLRALSKKNRLKYFGESVDRYPRHVNVTPSGYTLENVSENDRADSAECSTESRFVAEPGNSGSSKAEQNLHRILRTQARHKIPFLFRAEAANMAGVTGGTTVQQAERLGLERGIIRKHNLPFAKTQKCLWEITDAGYGFLDLPKPTWPSKGGYIHTAAVHRIAHTFENHGFDTKIEYRRSNGKLVDLRATRSGETIYVEVCASLPVVPKEISNIEKDTEDDPIPDKIIVAVTERRMRQPLEKAIEELKAVRAPLPEISIELAGDLIDPLEVK